MSTKSNKSVVESRVTVDSPIKSGDAIAPSVPKTLTPYCAIMNAMPASCLVPKTALDNAIAFARSTGFPDTFALYRDEVLSAVGRISGRSQWTSNGAKASVTLALSTAMTSVAKHEAGENKESGDMAKSALRDLKRVLAILAACGGASEFVLESAKEV